MFSNISETTPGIYIPVLFKWMTKERLAGIFEELDIMTIQDIDFNEKTVAGGYQGYNAFIHVKEWKDNKNANFVRKKLLNDEEVKIVFDSPKFFICKRKHELDELKETTTTTTTPPPQSEEQDETDSKPSLPSPCPECEEGVDGNQLMHTCIQKLIMENESEESN
jgi:hypothetical protein